MTGRKFIKVNKPLENMVKAPVEQVAEGKRASGQKLVSAVATVSEAMLMTPNKRMWGKKGNGKHCK